MSIWIVLAILAVMAALLIYAECCVDGDIDRQSEAHPPR
nr:MAG TPA: chitin synthase regulator [Caudoviricetes sp.]